MLEKALSAIANETSKTEYVVNIAGNVSTSQVSVTKKKNATKNTGDKKKVKPGQFNPKPFLDPSQDYSNPTPRPYSSTYGGKKWPENQPFVCDYCRQINKNIKVYKDHLKLKHKDGECAM